MTTSVQMVEGGTMILEEGYIEKIRFLSPHLVH